MKVELRYSVNFGKCDSSDWMPWKVDLEPDEMVAYNEAVEKKLPLNAVAKLQDALSRAYKEIEDEEISVGIDTGDEFVMECQGVAEMDPYELNSLVAARDAHALRFFGLTDADSNEIETWDAYDLEELPLIKDFIENFEPCSPYEAGWFLCVEFVDPNE